MWAKGVRHFLDFRQQLNSWPTLDPELHLLHRLESTLQRASGVFFPTWLREGSQSKAARTSLAPAVRRPSLSRIGHNKAGRSFSRELPRFGSIRSVCLVGGGGLIPRWNPRIRHKPLMLFAVPPPPSTATSSSPTTTTSCRNSRRAAFFGRRRAHFP